MIIIFKKIKEMLAYCCDSREIEAYEHSMIVTLPLFLMCFVVKKAYKQFERIKKLSSRVF